MAEARVLIVSLDTSLQTVVSKPNESKVFRTEFMSVQNMNMEKHFNDTLPFVSLLICPISGKYAVFCDEGGRDTNHKITVASLSFKV